MNTKMLFMPSTPLNVLISAAVARRFPEAQKQIWLIDQKRCDANPYYDALLAWPSSPFEHVKIFCAEAKGLRAKLRERKHLFAGLTADVKAFCPEVVAVGSDRRVEFQYVMAQLQEQGRPAKGIYLDDGLYSYAGRKHSPFKDGVNRLLKRMAYGRWYEEPQTVGASRYVQEAWLFKPELAFAGLHQQCKVMLEPAWFKDARLTEFSMAVAKTLRIDIEKFTGLDLLVMVPHPNNLQKMPGRAQQIQAYVTSQRAAGRRVGVKYHPRTQAGDFLRLTEAGAEVILPAQLAFEFILPVLKGDCQVVADVGTVLLTTRWLRPDLNVTAVLDEKDRFQRGFIPLFNVMQVSVVNDFTRV